MLNGGKVYLYPLEPEYMMQITVPSDRLINLDEAKGTADLIAGK
jgi:hypothetical protein